MNSQRASLMTFPDSVTLMGELGPLGGDWVQTFRAEHAQGWANEDDLRPESWVQWVFAMGWSYGGMLEREYGDYCRCDGECCA